MMYDLNTLVVNQPKIMTLHLYEAHGINDRGQIIALGMDGAYNGAYLLTPIQSSAAIDLLLLN